MTTRPTTPLWVGLLGATVLTPVLTSAAWAQSADELNAQGDPCGALTALAAEEDRLRDEWVQTATTTVEAGDTAQCQAFYDQAVAELAALDQGGTEGTFVPTEEAETAQTAQTAQAPAEGAEGAEAEGAEAS